MNINNFEFKSPEYRIDSVGRTQCQTAFLKPGDRVQVINDAKHTNRSKLLVNGEPYSINGNEWVFLNRDIHAFMNQGWVLEDETGRPVNYRIGEPYVDLVAAYNFTIPRQSNDPQPVKKGDVLRLYKAPSYNWYTVTDPSETDPFRSFIAGRKAYINDSVVQYTTLFDDSLENDSLKSDTSRQDLPRKFTW